MVALDFQYGVVVFEREDDATALFSSVPGNLDGEGLQIEDCERTFTGINVCPHWSAMFSTITPKTAAESIAR